MFLLRAYRPERFGHAGPVDRIAHVGPPADSASPAACTALAHAAEALAPVPPAEPHRLMPPEQLADALAGADAIGALYREYPDLDRERYKALRVEADAPAALARRRERHARATSAASRRDAAGDGGRPFLD